MKKQVVIQSWAGGITDDIRQQSASGFALSKHFNIFSNPNRLTPYRSTETDTNDGSTSDGMKQYDVRNFQLGIDGKLYGIGIQPGSTTRVKVVSKTDPTSGNWTLPATAEAGVNGSASWRNCFFEWAGFFWMFGGTGLVSKWAVGGAFTDSAATVGTTITHVAQGVLAPDNNAYMFYNNTVVRVSAAGAITDAVLVLPSNGRITNATMYGRYMAIGWATGTVLGSGGRSRVFLWDLGSPDVSEVIDWGEGQLMVVGNIEGKLVGVTDYFMSSSLGITQGAVVIRMYSGGYPVVVKDLKVNQTVSLGAVLRDTVVKENRLYFATAIPFGTSTTSQSTFHLGIWAFGRKNENSGFALTLDYVEEGVDTGNFLFRSFGNAGNYWFINHSVDGSISKTDDTAAYTFTSFIETQKYNDDDLASLKTAKGVHINTPPLPSGAQYTVKYKVDSETSFTTIASCSTLNSLGKDHLTIESTGKNLPQFHEIQFRIESTGGAEIDGFKFVYEVDKTALDKK